MRTYALALLFPILLLGDVGLYAQTGSNDRYIKVITTNGTYRGALTDISDTSLSIMCHRPSLGHLEIPAGTIYRIKIKKPFFKTVGTDMALGAGAAAFFVISYYLKNVFNTPDDPPFLTALWGSTALGATAGCLYGVVDAGFVRVRIPIKKDLFIFQNNRRRLSKYLD